MYTIKVIADGSSGVMLYLKEDNLNIASMVFSAHAF
jgi:hypothetical protein